MEDCHPELDRIRLLNRCRGALLSVSMLLVSGTTGLADDPRPFLFLKTGEKFATQEIAGPTVALLTGYLGDRLAGSRTAYTPRVMNQPTAAAALAATEKPVLGIVTPGFYVAYRKAFALEPVAEVQRRKMGESRFVLVTAKGGPPELDQLAGKRLATDLAPEQRYVMSVILQNKLGQELHFIEVTDLEGALFDLAEQADQAADLVLVHHTLWDLYRDDPDLGPHLQAVYTSESLPHDLLVVFRANAGELSVENLQQIVTGMGDDEQGQTVLQSIRVESFVPVNRERLERAEEMFHGR